MATYLKPDQGFSWSMPDSGQFFGSSSDSSNQALFYRDGNTIKSLDMQSYGMEIWRQKAAALGLSMDGRYTVGTPEYSKAISLGIPVQEYNGVLTFGGQGSGWEAIRVGNAALAAAGIVRSGSYNLADVFQVFGQPTQMTDPIPLIGKIPVVQGEVITDSINPSNPYNLNRTSNLQGLISQGPSLAQTLGAAGATPEQIATLTAAATPTGYNLTPTQLSAVTGTTTSTPTATPTAPTATPTTTTTTPTATAPKPVVGTPVLNKAYISYVNGMPTMEINAGMNTPYGYSVLSSVDQVREAIRRVQEHYASMAARYGFYDANGVWQGDTYGKKILDSVGAMTGVDYKNADAATLFKALATGGYIQAESIPDLTKAIAGQALGASNITQLTAEQARALGFSEATIASNVGGWYDTNAVNAQQTQQAALAAGTVTQVPLGSGTGTVPVNSPAAANLTSSTTPMNLTTTLRSGSQGAEVKALQTFLGITADGIFGPATLAAVKAYQTANGLTADGIVGPNTIAKINGTTTPTATTTATPTTTTSTATTPTSPATTTSTASTTLQVGSTGQAVKDLQTKLGITADGIYGPDTKAAVMAYQTANGLTADGIVGPLTVAKMSTNPPATSTTTGGTTEAGTTQPPAGTTTPTAPTTNTTLQVGSTGQAVKDLQTQLGITADGIYGPDTKAAVMAYQTANGLTADGIVGPLTSAKLSTTPATGTPPVDTTTPPVGTTSTTAPAPTDPGFFYGVDPSMRDTSREQAGLQQEKFIAGAAGTSGLIGQDFLKTLASDPSLIGFYVNALTYGGYTTGDVLNDMKRRELIASGNTQVKAMAPIISSSQNRTTYLSTAEGQKSVTDTASLIPTFNLQGLMNPEILKYGTNMPSELFKEIVPILNTTSQEYKDAVANVKLAYADLANQQLQASTEQEKAVADFNYNNFKEEIKKKYGIALSDDAQKAWTQIGDLENTFETRGISDSGLKNEAIDKALSATRKTDQKLRQDRLTEEQQKQAAVYTASATPAQIKALIDEDVAKGLPREQWRATQWGLVPSAEIVAQYDLNTLKAKYPDQTEAELKAMRDAVLDENGNYRSSLYNKYYTNLSSNLAAKKKLAESMVTSDALAKEKQAYIDYDKTQPFSIASPTGTAQDAANADAYQSAATAAGNIGTELKTSVPAGTSSVSTGSQVAAPVTSTTTKSPYTIAYGDTLSSIAARNSTTVEALAKLNNITDPNKIIAGSTIKFQ